MRPGPGLVVMALAFISGARRGSTSTSSESSSSSSTLPTSKLPSDYYYTSSAAENEVELPPSLVFPAYLSGSSVISTQGDDASVNRNQQEREGSVYYSSDYKYFYYEFYPLPSFVSSKHLRPPPENSPGQLATLSTFGSTSRATRQTRRKRSNSNSDGAGGDGDGDGDGEGDGDGNQNKNGDRDRDGDSDGDVDIVDNVISGSSSGSGGGGGGDSRDDNEGSVISGDVGIEDDSSDGSIVESSGSGRSEGLLVQFPSSSADASRSFDEDDILALVAEDDLLSEESFDRLTKFADDNLGYINEEDYDFAEDGKGSGIKQFSKEKETENSFRQQVENRTTSENSNGSESGSGLLSNEENENDNFYAGNVVGSRNTIAAVADNSLVAAFSENILSYTAVAHEKRRESKWSILENDSALARLNPWISACDLAQPGTPPDLQGQCSAGSLPVAWVDEGPGPPTCPISCQRLQLNKVNNFNTNTNNNNVNNLVNTNNIHFKLFNNNYYNTGTMLKVRRDLNRKANNDTTTNIYVNNSSATAPVTASATRPTLGATAKTRSLQQHGRNSYVDQAAGPTLSSGNQQNRDNNNIFKNSHVGAKLVNNIANHNNYAYYSKQQTQSINEQQRAAEQQRQQHQQHQQHQQQQQQQQQQQKEQQCLDYLGDTEETEPANFCFTKSPSELAALLRTLRLRHCCERNVFSALHTLALNATLGGGAECNRTLTYVMELDRLASRITCELAEILFRFDCRQIYSLIHQCDDCKEAYRRWVCSTLIPYFAEQSDVHVSPSNNYNNNNNNNDININDSTNVNIGRKINIHSNTYTNDDVSNKVLRRFSTDDDSNKFQIAANVGIRKKREAIQHTNSSAASFRSTNGSSFDNIKEGIGITNISTSLNDDATEPIMPPVLKRSKREANINCTPQQQLKQGLHQQLQQSNIFISTANNEGPCVEDPVILNLMKRSKRKVEFRKRRRIRPCLSVCQTVEQQCPYLLPADRAPALPTQYAGEPTFLCLDQNIPETGEQLRKSSYGPADCCYAYCGNVAQGICAYCSEFVEPPLNTTRRMHNVTLIPTDQHQVDARLAAALTNDTASRRTASISIALSNAFYEGIYYYDENTSDMAEDAISDNCPMVPSVTSRCSVPYPYVSKAVAQRIQPTSNALCGHNLLLWLSAFFCLLTSQTAALQLKQRRRQQLHIVCVSHSAEHVPPTTITMACQGCAHRWRQLPRRTDDTTKAAATTADTTTNSAAIALIIVKLTINTFFIHNNNNNSGNKIPETNRDRHCWRIVRKSRIKHKCQNICRGRRSKRFSQNCNNRVTRSNDRSSGDYIGFLKNKHTQMIMMTTTTTYRLKNSKMNFSSIKKYYRSKSYKKFRNCNTTNTDYKSNNNYNNNNNKEDYKNTNSNFSNNNNTNNNNTNSCKKNSNSNTNNKNNCNNNNNNTKNCNCNTNIHNGNNYKNVNSAVTTTATTARVKTNDINNRYNVCQNFRFYYYNFNTNDWWRRWRWMGLVISHLFNSSVTRKTKPATIIHNRV